MDAPPEVGPEQPGYLDARVMVPIVLAAGLFVAAPLLWAGAHGTSRALLALFYGGIAILVVGVAIGLLVGVPSLFSLILVGIVWIVLERTVLATGSWFAWAAVPVGVVGVLLLPGPVATIRRIARARRAWAETKGGSVPP